MKEISPYSIRPHVAPGPTARDPNHDDDFSIPVQAEAHVLWDYWLTVRRNRWLILGISVAVILTAISYVFTKTPLYTAQTVLLIERKAPQILKVQDARAE